MTCVYYKLYIHYLDPYIPYEVNVYAVTMAGAGKSSHEIFFTMETGINFKSQV